MSLLNPFNRCCIGSVLLVLIYAAVDATALIGEQKVHHTLRVQPDGCKPTPGAKQSNAGFLPAGRHLVVLTAAIGLKGLQPPGLAMFIRTVLKSDPDLHVVITVAENFTLDTAPVQDHRVHWVPIRLEGEFRWKMTPLKTRYYSFSCFLWQHIDSISHAYISDSRDVIMQSPSIFKVLGTRTASNQLHVFQEHSLTRIGDNVNYEWINICYGKAVAETVKGFFILNSGAIFGGVEAMAKTCAMLVSQLNSINCDIDQAMLNVIVYLHKLVKEDVSVRTHANEYGPVFTGYDAFKTGFRTHGCEVRNLQGKAYSVVHQYDRLPVLNALMVKCHAG